MIHYLLYTDWGFVSLTGMTLALWATVLYVLASRQPNALPFDKEQ